MKSHATQDAERGISVEVGGFCEELAWVLRGT